MGIYLEPADLKQRTDSPLLKRLEADDLDDRFIIPAERAIERSFSLDLDTDGIPRFWEARFLERPDLELRFQNDYRIATIILVNRMADNQFGYASRSVGGASVVYAGSRMPEEVSVLMSPWATQGNADMGRVRRG
jgi:hypothetical protein